MKFLMAYPDYYDVNYSINSWMDIKNKPDKNLAVKQWQRLFHLLITLGADVQVVNAVNGFPDLVFAANAGTVKEYTFIPSNFKYPERQGETDIFTKWFRDNGYQAVELPKGIYHEGAGDLLKLDVKYIQGYGYRSDYESTEMLSYLLDSEIIPVELTNGYFYHLDTCFCPFKLDKSFFMYCDKAFSVDSLNVLENLPYDMFCVPFSEAKLFACNSIQVGDNVILQEGCNETAKWLEKQGFKVIFIDMSAYHLSGGSAACCQLRI